MFVYLITIIFQILYFMAKQRKRAKPHPSILPVFEPETSGEKRQFIHYEEEEAKLINPYLELIDVDEPEEKKVAPIILPRDIVYSNKYQPYITPVRSMLRPKRTYRKRKRYVRKPYRARRKYARARTPYTKRRYARKKIGGVSLPKFTFEETAYINTVTNPFGNMQRGAVGNHLGGRIPDTSGEPSQAVTLTSSIAYTPTGGAASCLFMACPWVQNQNYAILGVRGGAVNPTPDHKSNSQWNEFDGLTNVRQWRIVGWALKVNFTSSKLVVAGSVRAGLVHSAICAADDQPVPYTTQADEMHPFVRPLQGGCTVRWVPSGQNDLNWLNPVIMPGDPAPNPNRYLITNSLRNPSIFIQGLPENCSVVFQAVLHLEVIQLQYISPYAIKPSPISLRWGLLYALATHPDFAPMITSGNSFKNFFSSGFQLAKKALLFLSKHGAEIGQTVEAISSFFV